MRDQHQTLSDLADDEFDLPETDDLDDDAFDGDWQDEDEVRTRPSRELAIVLLVGGIIGFIFSTWLMIDKVEMLKNPNFRPACSINPVIACGSVLTTEQAAVFGFPNPLMGIAGFPLLAFLGVCLLLGQRFPGWIWACVQAAATAAIGLVTWMQYESLYMIGALCPWCMVVWVVTIAVFVLVTLQNFRRYLASPLADALYRWRWGIVVLWYLLILAAITQRFWYFWSSAF